MTRSFTVDREHGMVLGVCRGLADYADAPVALVRIGAVMLTLLGLGLPGILAYCVIGFVARHR